MSGGIEAHVSHLGDSNRQCVVRMFGPTTVLLGKRSLGSRDFGGRKPRQFFELLVLARGAAVPKDRLADLIWGDELPANVVATIETNISVLRSALDPGGSWGRRLVLTEPDAYRIDESLVELDLDTFSSLVTAAGLEQGPDRLLLLREAIELATGEVLVDEGYVDWAVRVRERYRIDVVLAQIDAARAALDHGEAGLALEFAEAALESEPLSEPAMICKLGALADLQRRTRTNWVLPPRTRSSRLLPTCGRAVPSGSLSLIVTTVEQCGSYSLRTTRPMRGWYTRRSRITVPA